MKKYDVFVIGSGMAGMTVANKCAAGGLKVGITDELAYGGTCALRGCDPKKVIIGATEVRDFAHRLKGIGIDTVPQVNWKDIMAFKQSFVNDMPPKIEKGYKQNGIDTYHTAVKFISENTLQLGKDHITANNFVIATGAKPRELTFEGGHFALSSTEFLNMKDLPGSMLFIGGGYIAFEFAHIAARCGSKVTIVHRGKHPLKNFEQDIVKHLIDATRDLGIELILETEVLKIEKKNDDYLVSGKSGETMSEFKVEAVFNSAGRPPAIFDLDLVKANIAYSEKGIEVNSFLQNTTNKKIYAAGDSADTNGLPLTPIAVMEGHIVASNIIKGNKKEVNYPPTPSVVFTLPVLTGVGLTEEQARNKEVQYKVNYQSAENWFNAKRLNVKQYAFKTIIDKNTNSLLGAHIIGPNAEEIINIFAIAIKTGIKVAELKKMIYTYPTMASDIPHMV
ncbi:NAD(P)/FAD-dependent oxidoreductase [Christiangramia fulva]|uniref:NAD(P)/FAD-dependent oxidoreductase n=1 Tax=Christiangramia fulva TaxID=2126553 RepID=A0A2R3Z1U1_9FLAO|nr:NAD(P)/FAD-dependent oxidoreductase [Christiangramia fulva]AVR44205.1 NAD(P)/FAD-dependent oxidoreductase [Christiangramia fulva]